MNRNNNKKLHNQKKKYTQSQIKRCEIAIKVKNSRDKHETEHKTLEIQTYIHAFIIRKLHIYYILFLSHLRSCVLKLMSVLHEVIWVGIEFQRDAPAKEKLVLNRSILGLGSIIDRDGARTVVANKKVFEILGCQISKSFED